MVTITRLRKQTSPNQLNDLERGGIKLRQSGIDFWKLAVELVEMQSR